MQVSTVVENTTADTAPAVVFTTTEDLVISPPVLQAALTRAAKTDLYQSVWDDLRYEQGSVTCFSSLDANGKLVPGDVLLFGFAESLAGMALRLSVTAHAKGIGVDPRTPPLIWEIWDGTAWIAAQLVSDSTGGLNRAGEIVLIIPAGHESLTLADIVPTGYGSGCCRRCRVSPRTRNRRESTR